MEIEGTCASNNFDETVRLQCEKSGYERKEKRDYKELQRARSSASCRASASAAPFDERNECPGTYCSLIEKPEREDSSC